MKKEKNPAFIDGQNLYISTKTAGWSVDYKKFRIYLKDKYHIDEAYYYLGFVSEEEQDLYDALQKAGFILVFREHSSVLKGKKKGNVDTDIVFSILQKIIDDELIGKIVLVSGDGDYKKLVSFLIKKDLFEKLLMPNKKFASSLYNSIGSKYYTYLENSKNKIAF